MNEKVREYVELALAFEREAQSILLRYESSRHRIVTISDSYKRIAKLEEKHRSNLVQAARCVEVGAFRASYVLSWLTLMGTIQICLSKDGFLELNKSREKWNVGSIEQLRESYTEFAQIEAARDAGLFSKNQSKALHGLLNDRNRCAHPDEFEPDLNSTLGFLSNVMTLLESVAKKL